MDFRYHTLKSRNEMRRYLNADAINMNAKYITIPTTPHLNHNLTDLSRPSKQNLMEFPNGNKPIALTPKHEIYSVYFLFKGHR